MSKHTLAGVEVGPAHPCRFVAEIGNAHNGSITRAFELIEAAKEAGADFLKTQCYTPDELVALRGDGPAPDPWGADWSMRDLYEKAQTPHDWFPELVAHCKEVGIPWFSSVFGQESLDLLESLDCPVYKIAALDSGMGSLRRMVQATNKPILTSTRGPFPDVLVGQPQLYCPEGYPQTELHLRNIREGFLGFSYHGTTPEVPFTAALIGASLVEFHFHLADHPSELEANVSLDEHQAAEMIGAAREASGWVL